MSLGFFLYFAPATGFRRAANRRLNMQLPEDAAQVWRLTRQWQARLAPKRPRHSASVNIMMRQMEWSCALYRALLEYGMDPAEAGALVEAVGSDIYRPVPVALFRMSRLRSGKRDTRVRWLLGLMTRYLFSAPFVHRHLPSQPGVAFDVTHCPFADYFRDQGVPELTPFAACNPDHCAARAYGVKLVRTQTIAGGADYCDFRWQFPTSAAD